ncbi:hypothetical protein [Mesorhizobium sp. PAMC28654]|uniref:hypothetical protein n=1 Tax=Mesorhizobium sp. PAMC28654 TaxID=2880934 RepID=UPI0029CABF86|nr:hypothetical protein [Mesorhizobium sp. PAMC28654]
MATKLPATDVVIIGLGWAGSIIANELTDEGLDVVALERGPWRDTAADFNLASAPDELRYVQRQELMLRTAQTPSPRVTIPLKPRCRCAVGVPSTRVTEQAAPATIGPASPSGFNHRNFGCAAT